MNKMMTFDDFKGRLCGEDFMGENKKIIAELKKIYKNLCELNTFFYTIFCKKSLEESLFLELWSNTEEYFFMAVRPEWEKRYREILDHIEEDEVQRDTKYFNQFLYGVFSRSKRFFLSKLLNKSTKELPSIERLLHFVKRSMKKYNGSSQTVPGNQVEIFSSAA